MSKPWSVPEPPPLHPAVPGLSYEALQKCIHCGFCMQACPTYRLTGVEVASPRGRLSLMRAVAEGQLPADEGVADPLSLCLGCRACESACPSGVPYGQLLEEARHLMASVAPQPWYVRLALRHLLPWPGRLRVLAALAREAQRHGLLRLAPGALRGLAAALPPLAEPRSYAGPAGGGVQSEAVTPPLAPGAGPMPRPSVLFFHGCIQEAFLQPQNQAAVRVLEAAGYACTVLPGQTCCGALHAHTGSREEARELARRNIRLFGGHEGLIVNHAGGCGAHLKEYGHLLADDPEWAGQARAFSARVRDLSEVLDPASLTLSPLPGLSVTYQDSCHLAHGQKIRTQPRRLIRAIPDILYRELPGADQCCGSAGIYNLLQPEMARRVLDEKMDAVAGTRPAAVVTANPGCYLQLRQGVQAAGLADQVEVLTLAELLDRALPPVDRRR